MAAPGLANKMLELKGEPQPRIEESWPFKMKRIIFLNDHR